MTTLDLEGYKAFDVIAGSSFGGWSDRDIAIAIIKDCIDISPDSGTAERLWRELAKSSDDEINIEAWTAELEEIAVDHLPPYCTLTWRDNELTVLPYIDDELPRYEYHLDRPIDGDTFEYLHINDHGNTDLMIWNHNAQAFENIWSIV